MPKKLYHYRPQRTSPEILEAISVSREHLLQGVLDRLLQCQPGTSRQHYLLIGPRGIGKTHVLILIAHRIFTTPTLAERWFPVLFPEESYGIAGISDLLLEALHILLEETGDKELVELYHQVCYDNDDDRVTDLVLDALRKFHRSKGLGLVFLIENINRILEQQIKDKIQIHLLRKILTEEDWLVTVCTSPTYLDAVIKENEPLFEFFKVHFLEELSPGEQLKMLEKLAIYDGNKDFQVYLHKYRSRLKALYHFTGGNPRLTIMLYQLISSQACSDVQTELDRLLNEITPFYQDRMKDINEQEGKLVQTMALLAEGCTPTELARESRLEAKIVRTVLGRLEKAGYVRREQRRQKKTIYIIPERLFRIWHQMNHSRASKGLIRYLLEFFSTWYQTKQERDEAWDEIIEKIQMVAAGDEERNEDLDEYMNYIIAVSEEGERFERQFDRIRKLILPKGIESVEDELKRLDSAYEENGNYFIHKGIFYVEELGEHEAAIQAFQKASALKPDDIIPLFNQALSLESLGMDHEADKIYTRIVEQITGQINRLDSLETLDTLLNIIKNGDHDYFFKISAHIIRRFSDERIIDKIISILKHSNDLWRISFCINTLGDLRARQAASLILSFLHDNNNIVRGSAATALGRIGSEKAFEPLVEMLYDEAQDVRISAVIALINIVSEKQIPNLDKVIDKIFKQLSEDEQQLVDHVARALLNAAFRSGDFNIISNAYKSATQSLDLPKLFYMPYEVALEYLKSNRDPAILERQHPEMRDAVRLLTDFFDKRAG